MRSVDMGLSVLLVVDPGPGGAGGVSGVLDRRFGVDYQVLAESSLRVRPRRLASLMTSCVTGSAFHPALVDNRPSRIPGRGSGNGSGGRGGRSGSGAVVG